MQPDGPHAIGMPPSAPVPPRRATWWFGRAAIGAIAAGTAVVLALHEAVFRGWEAFAAGHVVALVTRAPAYTHRSTFYVDLGRPDIFGLRVTDECTAAIIAIGILGITAIVAAVTRVKLRRLVVATTVAVIAFFAFNQVRLLVIALSTRQWGLGSGYHWSHVWAGSFITVFGAAAVLALYLVLLGAFRRTSGRSNAMGAAL